jgi:futalosine hydrolase
VNILLVASSKNEIAPLLKKASLPENVQFPVTLHFGGNKIDIIITSPGMVACSYHLTRYLHSNECDLAINAGIAGSYSRELSLGEVVEVKQEIIGDLGVDNRGEFNTIFEEQLILPDQFPYKGGWLINPNQLKFAERYPQKKGITLNMVSGSEERIRLFRDKFTADIETMEGAAFFYVCLSEDIPFLELRAISNYVEPRNKSSWEIPTAVDNLNRELLKIFELMK